MDDGASPAARHRAAASAAFLDSLASPSCQRFLAGDFGAGPATVQQEQRSPDARLQHTLSAMLRKGELLGGELGGAGAGGIAAYLPPPPPTAPLARDGERPASPGYLSQLQAAAAALAPCDGAAAGLRLQVAELRQALGAAEARQQLAADQAARGAAAQAQLEEQVVALEKAAAQREAELGEAAKARRALEQEAAAAKAQVGEGGGPISATGWGGRAQGAAAVQKAAKGRAEEWERERQYLKQQLSGREAELKALEEAVQAAAADGDRRGRDVARREAELAAAATRAHDAAAAARAEAAAAQEAAEGATKRARALEAANAELRKQKAQMLADMQVLEELLGEADTERRRVPGGGRRRGAGSAALRWVRCSPCCRGHRRSPLPPGAGLPARAGPADARLPRPPLPPPCPRSPLRRDLHDKYCQLGEVMEGLARESAAIRDSACQESDAARAAVERAARSAEAAAGEHGALASRAAALAQALEAERAARAALKDKASRKLVAAEAEVGALRGELETKARQLSALQGDMRALQAEVDSKLHACEAQVSGFKERLSSLARELESERRKAGQAREAAEGVCQERMGLELQQQALKYERRIQELEMQWGGGSGGGGPLPCVAGGPSRGSVLDYIPRAEHVRLLEARLAAKDADMQLELGARVHQAEKEWAWKLEGKEQEVTGLNARVRQLENDLHGERQAASSHAHKLGDEAKRSAARCVELQRELESQAKELTQLKARRAMQGWWRGLGGGAVLGCLALSPPPPLLSQELLKDARAAAADLDDDALTTNRQVARLRHALEDCQAALKGAQAAAAAEHKRVEEQVREAEGARAAVEDAARREARLEGELAQLSTVLEQKQELIAALQAECDAWGGKLIAAREGVAREIEAARLQAKQEQDARLTPLEQRCQELAAQLAEARRVHDAAAAEAGRRHAAEVGALEARAAEAARREGELRAAAEAAGTGRQQEAEALKASMHKLEAKLAEAQQRLAGERLEHRTRAVALTAQVRRKMGALREEHKALRAQVQGDVAQACAEFQALCEPGMAALRQQAQDAAVAAAAAQQTLGAQAERLRGNLRQLLEVLAANLPRLPREFAQQMLDAAPGAAAAGVAQVAAALEDSTEQAAAAAVEEALGSLEAALAPDAAPSATAGPAAWPAATGAPGSSAAAAAARVIALLGQWQEAQAKLAASEAQAAAATEAAAGYESRFARAKEEAAATAEAARVAAVAPLQAEVKGLQERVEALQERHQREVGAVRDAAAAAAQRERAEAQRVLDRTAAQARDLQQQLAQESEGTQELSGRLGQLQDELAKQAQRAAASMEAKEREVGALKEHVREMDARDARRLSEIASLKQQQQQQQQQG
eukprot:scaffold5.g610.t1